MVDVGVVARDKKVSRRREKGQEEDNEEREGEGEELEKVNRGSKMVIRS